MKPDSRNPVAWLGIACGDEKHRIRYDGKHLRLLSHTDQTFAQFMRTWSLMGRPKECGCAVFAHAFQEALRQEYPEHHLSLGHYIRTYSTTWYTTGHLVANAMLRKKWRRDLARVSAADQLEDYGPTRLQKLSRIRTDRMLKVFTEWRRGLGDYYNAVIPDWTPDHKVSVGLKARRRTGSRLRYLHMELNGSLWGQETYGWPRMMDCDGSLVLGKKVDDKGVNYKLLACLPALDKSDPWRVVFRRRVFVEDPDTGGLRGDWAPIHKTLPITAHQKYGEVYP